ncbi:hypothetical protein F5972_09905 [Microbispora cellulosiformans]|uniref:Uncharacterized protein n=1 Tax=Microbispora cellulosiformans TaxID=2614688 RepID=A0A5J5K904_9ACTN|nr:hypothetical protein [Microbispora cellulosiformans]KAA9379929.1 hypothetical protein F5972_09905 [Microbispora cellulosiformans]
MFRTAVARLVPLAAAALVAATALPASAEVIDPAPIAPNQYFYGYVNGQTGHATIKMACFGPVYPGQTGHPLAGQSVEVRPLAISSSAASAGYTGGGGTTITVDLGDPSTVSRALALRYYGVKAEIPVTATLPCYGSGKVTFTPMPTSWTARAATVLVDYVGQP